MSNSLQFIKDVISDFPEKASGFNSMILEPDSTQYAFSQGLIISYDRVQHINNVHEYLSEHANIMNSKDMIIITTSGPMAKSDTNGFFEPRTMKEIETGLNLYENFIDWELRYVDNNEKLFFWGIKG
jgi:hypothetical protein